MTYAVVEIYNADEGEALVGRLDTETDAPLDLKPREDGAKLDDQYAIWVYDRGASYSDYPANVEVTAWNPMVDDNGNIVPDMFEATISGDTKSIQISVFSEEPTSYIAINNVRTQFQEYTQGFKQYTYNLSANNEQYLYIHVLNQGDGTKSPRPIDGGRIYTLKLNPASTDRTLEAVRIAGDDVRLNTPTDWSSAPIDTDSRKVELEVASTSKTVDVGLRTNVSKAIIQVYDTDDNLVAIYDSNSFVTDTANPPWGDIDKSDPLDYVQGEGYLTLPVDPEANSTEYKVRVSSVLGDNNALVYDLILTKRPSGLRVDTITVNDSLAAQVRDGSNDYKLHLETADDGLGNLRLVVADDTASRNLLGSDSTLFAGDAQGHLKGDILTDLTRDNIQITEDAEGNLYLSFVGDSDPAHRSLLVSTSVDVYEAGITEHITTANIFAQLLNQGEYVDVHTALDSFRLFNDISDPDLLDMYMGMNETIFYPILVGSEDGYEVHMDTNGDGVEETWHLPAQIRVVVLKLTRSEDVADLDLTIKLARDRNDLKDVVTAAPPAVGQERHWASWNGEDQWIYEREATISNGVLNFDLTGLAKVSTSYVEIFNSDPDVPRSLGTGTGRAPIGYPIGTQATAEF